MNNNISMNTILLFVRGITGIGKEHLWKKMIFVAKLIHLLLMQ